VQDLQGVWCGYSTVELRRNSTALVHCMCGAYSASRLCGCNQALVRFANARMNALLWWWAFGASLMNALLLLQWCVEADSKYPPSSCAGLLLSGTCVLCMQSTNLNIVIALNTSLTTALLLLCRRPRAVKLVAVIATLLTPQVINDVMALLQACFTDERINR
jgi:hypothetical protein